MNYSTLFPQLLKQLPPVQEKDMCYHYQKKNNDNKNNDNKNTYFFLPEGKKMLLWFLKYDNNKYSILLEYDNYQKCFKKCFFQYLSFKDELTNGYGTIISCTRLKNEICMQKIVYLMGKKYEKYTIFDNMYDLKDILEKYIHQINEKHFMALKLPIMYNHLNLILQASNSPYNVYSIMKTNHYHIYMREFCADFTIIPVNIKRDTYQLWCIRHDKLVYYKNAYVNDYKTSLWLKQLFLKNPIYYKNIEFSDDEEEEPSEQIHVKEFIIQCIFIPSLKKWKPYKKTKNNNSNISKIKFIENKKYDYLL